VFTEEAEFLVIYQEQLDRWRAEPLTIGQRREVDRLGRQVARNRDVAAAILALAEELKATTIDAILAKSDLELGLELLSVARRPSHGAAASNATVGKAGSGRAPTRLRTQGNRSHIRWFFGQYSRNP
jgi:hypothetical protein